MRPKHINTAAILMLCVTVAATVAFTGCAPQSPVLPAPPAQLTASQANKTLADATNAAVKVVIELKAQGQVSAEDSASILAYCKVSALFSNASAAILSNGDTWDKQKAALISLAWQTALPNIAQVNPTARAIVAQVAILFDQFKSQLGAL